MEEYSEKICFIRKIDILPIIEFTEFPSDVNLSKKYKYEIRNQRTKNICSILSLITLIEYLRQIEGKEYIRLSESFLYYNSTKFEHKNGNFKTSSVLYSILKYGTCYSKRWESIYDLDLTPVNSMNIQALSNLKDANVEIIENSIECILYILGVCGRPIVANINNHSVVLIGYDSDNIYYQNSYGQDWGLDGFGKVKRTEIGLIIFMYSMSESCVKAFENQFKNITIINK